MSVKEFVTKEVEKLKKSLLREDSIKTQIENYKALLAHIDELEAAEKPLPEEITFKDYAEWKEYAQKKMKGKNTSILTIEKNRNILIALEYYVKHNSEE